MNFLANFLREALIRASDLRHSKGCISGALSVGLQAVKSHLDTVLGANRQSSVLVNSVNTHLLQENYSLRNSPYAFGSHLAMKPGPVHVQVC